MKKKQVYNPYAIQNKRPLFTKLLWLATLGAALVGTFFFFPLAQILLANSAPAFFRYLVQYLNKIVSDGALFAVLALGVCSIAHEEKALRRKLIGCEVACVLVISFALRIFLYWFLAFLDDKLQTVSFYFNDVPLSQLELVGWSVYSLLGVVELFLIVALSFLLVKRAYARSTRRGAVSSAMKKIPVLVYLAVGLVWAVVNTVLIIAEEGIAAEIGVIIDLIMPYVELAAVSLLGYYFLSFLTDCFEGKES